MTQYPKWEARMERIKKLQKRVETKIKHLQEINERLIKEIENGEMLDKSDELIRLKKQKNHSSNP